MTYDIECKHTDEAGTDSAWYTVTDDHTSAHWISVKVDTSTVDTSQHGVYVIGKDAHAIGKTFSCRIYGKVTGSSGDAALSDEFTFEFSPCGIPSYCANVTASHNWVGDISTYEGFFSDYG
jgi:hypothetical protein